MRKKIFLVLNIFLLLSGCEFYQKETSQQEETPATNNQSDDGWVSLFDGQTLDGWKANEDPNTFSVQDGMIVANGTRSHLFYVGPVQDANFTNFELKVEAMAKEGSNSGIFFHTEYQDSNWLNKGYEVQINNSHTDRRRTGSLWDVNDVEEILVEDDQWFTEHIIVQGKHIIIKVNGQTVVDFIEPEDFYYEMFPGRKISSGTFALQGHDPGSTAYFRSIMVKPLPD